MAKPSTGATAPQETRACNRLECQIIGYHTAACDQASTTAGNGGKEAAPARHDSIGQGGGAREVKPLSERAAHTPGPWSMDQPWNGFCNLRGPDGHVVFALAAPGPKFGDREYSEAEKEANARLIAAAPDLLAALKEVAHLGVEGEQVDRSARECMALVLHAIARAEGRV